MKISQNILGHVDYLLVIHWCVAITVIGPNKVEKIVKRPIQSNQQECHCLLDTVKRSICTLVVHMVVIFGISFNAAINSVSDMRVAQFHIIVLFQECCIHIVESWLVDGY